MRERTAISDKRSEVRAQGRGDRALSTVGETIESMGEGKIPANEGKGTKLTLAEVRAKLGI